MRNQLIFTIGIFLTTVLSVSAQQNAQYSQYMFHGLYINPAYSGYKEDLNMHSYYRSQWTNMDGGPRTLAFAADMLTNNEKVGLGLNIVGDRVGDERMTSAYLNYAYKLRLNESGTQKLSLGIGAGMLFSSYNNAGIITDQPEAIALESMLLPDMRFGVYYSTPSFFAGLGVDNMIATMVFNDKKASLQPVMHYYLNAGTLVPLNSDVLFKPSVLLKSASRSEGRALTGDINAAFIFGERITGGLSYRTALSSGTDHSPNLPKRNSMIVLAEFVAKSNFRIGYSFDYPLSSTINNLGGTHEISIGYSIAKQRVRERTPRFF